jgi:hypothetical protein
VKVVLLSKAKVTRVVEMPALVVFMVIELAVIVSTVPDIVLIFLFGGIGIGPEAGLGISTIT